MFNRFRSSALLLSGLLLAVGSAANAQNFLKNGSFENVKSGLTGTTQNLQTDLNNGAQNIDGWTVITTPAGSATQTLGWIQTPYVVPAQNGIRFLDLTGNAGSVTVGNGPGGPQGDNNTTFGGVRQTLQGGVEDLANNILEKNKKYTFSFYLGGFPSTQTPQFVSANVFINGVQQGSTFTLNPLTVANGWGQFSFDFTAAAGANQFDIVGAPSNPTDVRYIGLDNVSITAVSTVPEMPGAAMLLPALLPVGLVLGRKRRKSNS